MAPPPPQVFKRDGPTMFVKRQGPSDTDTDTTTPTSSSSSTTPTSSSTTPSSSSSTTPTSSSTTPSSSSSSTTSNTSTSTTPSTTSTPTPTLIPSASTRPDGGVVTLTLTSTPSATPTGNKGGGGGGFWNNKAEVGAVFGIAGAIGLVLIFIAVTTAIRRRRARKFDRDVAEAAAAAASASANPFFDDEDDRGNNGANWDPRRGSAYNAGYGKIHDDPYGYAAAGVVGGAAGAGFARQNTNQFQQRNPQDAYSMNDLASSGHQMSTYSGATTYNQPSSGAGYYDMPQPDYGRPSFSSNTAPGIAGVGAAGALAGVGTGAGQNQNQNLRYRGQPQQQRPLSSGSDAYGGYSDDYDRYPNPYAANPASTAFVQNTPGSQESHGNMVNQAYRSQSPPGRQTSPPLPAVPNSSSPPPPPSYSGHGHTNSAGQDLKFAGAARPSSEWQHGLVAASGSQGQLAPMSPPNASLPATPDESYDQKGRILRVANE